MKPLLRFLPLLLLLAAGSRASEPAFAAVRAADEQRIAATIHRDLPRLARLLDDDLRYANSDGRVQTKTEFLAAVEQSTDRYLSVTPRRVVLQQIAPGAVAMSGRAEIHAETAGRRVQFALQFLAVWREVSGDWRLLAYQSTPVPSTP